MVYIYAITYNNSITAFTTLSINQHRTLSSSDDATDYIIRLAHQYKYNSRGLLHCRYTSFTPINTNILNKDTLPSRGDANVTLVNSIQCIGTTPLTQLIDEWTDRNNTAYIQILLCISPELQTAIDATDVASKS